VFSFLASQRRAIPAGNPFSPAIHLRAIYILAHILNSAFVDTLASHREALRRINLPVNVLPSETALAPAPD